MAYCTPNQFLETIYPTNTHCGQLPIMALDPVAGRSRQFTVDVSDLIEFMGKAKPKKSENWYIPSSSYCGKQRCKSHMWYTHAVVIDCDIHAGELDRDLLEGELEELIFRLINDSDSEELLPPTGVVHTGRGIQLWWGLRGIRGVTKNNATQIILERFRRCVYHRLYETIRENPTGLTNIEVDTGASSNEVGLYRLPGTYNANTVGHQVSCELISGKTYDYHEINGFQKAYRKEHGYKTVNSARRAASIVNMGSSAPQTIINKKKCPDIDNLPNFTLEEGVQGLMSYLETLKSFRNRPIGEENRNNFTLVYFSLAKEAYGDVRALELACKFNHTFKKPLTDAELRSTLYTARKKTYHYRKAILDILHITEEEIAAIGRLPLFSTTRKSRSVVAPKKKERNQHILSLYSAGVAVTVIAKKLKIARATVYRVLSALNRKVSTKELFAKVLKERKIARQALAKNTKSKANKRYQYRLELAKKRQNLAQTKRSQLDCSEKYATDSPREAVAKHD